MGSKDELQAFMKAMADEVEGSQGPCPGAPELMAYAQGLGDEPTREAIASHVPRCRECRQTVLDAHLFLEAPPAESAGAVDLDREWSRFAEVSGAGRRPRAVVAPMRPVRTWSWFSQPTVAWATGLAVVTLASVGWGLRTEGRRRAEVAAAQNRIQRLEAENRSLRAAQQSVMASLTAPRLDAAIFDVYSRAVLDRSGGPRASNRLRLAATAPVVLILNGEGQPAFPAYAVRVLDREGRAVWQGEGLKRGSQGNFTISFPAGFFRAGEYRLELSGTGSGAPAAVAAYDLSTTVNGQ